MTSLFRRDYLQPFKVHLTFALVLTSCLLFFCLWFYNPLLPVPHLVISSQPSSLPFWKSLIQRIGGTLFFLYGAGAWAGTLLLATSSLLAWQTPSWSRAMRILALLLTVPFSSMLAFFYHFNTPPFTPGGVIGKSLATLSMYYIPLQYRLYAGIIISCLLIAAMGQDILVTLGKKLNSFLRLTQSISALGNILASWFFFLFPFLRKFVHYEPKNTYNLEALIQTAITQDYQELLDTYVPEKVIATPSTLAEIETEETELSLAFPEYPLPYEEAELLIKKLASFDIKAECVDIKSGPRVTNFLIRLAEGVRVSTLLAREDDLVYALGKQSIRIYIPAPGTKDIGIEIENDVKHTISLKSLFHHSSFVKPSQFIPLMLGTTTTGLPFIADLATMPHALIAGTTGSGKSVTMHSLILSMLWHFDADHLKLILVDPKRLECALYASLDHLLFPVLHESEEICNALDACITEMRTRYQILAEHHVRTIQELYAKDEKFKTLYPYYAIIIDEYADIRMTIGEQCEKKIVSLCQMARAAGIHVILATQRPSVDIISGLVKANIPTRIACKVSSKVDSKIVIDTQGAEKLLGKGDMLYLDSGGNLQRLHGAYISTAEIDQLLCRLTSLKLQKNSSRPSISASVHS